MNNNKSPVKGYYPLSVKRIYLSNGKVLKDHTVFLLDNFLVVDGTNDPSDPRPSMYNYNLVEKLEKVEEIRPQPKVSVSGVW